MQFVCEFVCRDHFKHSTTRLDPQEDDAIEKIGRGDVGNFSSSKYLELGEHKNTIIYYYSHTRITREVFTGKLHLAFFFFYLFQALITIYLFKSPPLGPPLHDGDIFIFPRHSSSTEQNHTFLLCNTRGGKFSSQNFSPGSLFDIPIKRDDREWSTLEHWINQCPQIYLFNELQLNQAGE